MSCFVATGGGGRELVSASFGKLEVPEFQTVGCLEICSSVDFEVGAGRFVSPPMSSLHEGEQHSINRNLQTWKQTVCPLFLQRSLAVLCERETEDPDPGERSDCEQEGILSKT